MASLNFTDYPTLFTIGNNIRTDANLAPKTQK